MIGFRQAQWLALALPAALLGGAYISEYGFGLFPCEMCWWQRYPHFAALGIAVLAQFMQPKRVWTALAALAILTSGAIGGFHAGVEYGWWPGITDCAAAPGQGSSLDLTNPTIVSCDIPQWSLWGISLAGWNFLFSGAGGLTILGSAIKGKN